MLNLVLPQSLPDRFKKQILTSIAVITEACALSLSESSQFSNGQNPPTDGLIAYYPFNGNADDSSGHGNQGAVYGSTIGEDRFGNQASAYSFDGVDDCILASDSDTLDLQSSLSLAAWVKTDGRHEVESMIVAKHFTHWARSYTLFDSTGASRSHKGIVLQLIDREDQTYETNPYPIDTSWRFVVGTYDELSGITRLYLDGEMFAVNHIGSIKLMQTQVPLTIGCYLLSSSGSSRRAYFHGLIDDVRIYNRALSESEIQTLYGEGGWPSR